MDFLEKKKQINEYYDVIIKKIERQDGVKDICQCLLKLASFLNAFSSASIIEKDSILKKAIELLNAEKDFSKTCDYESLYKRLTGRELIKVKPKEIKEEDNKNEDDPIKKEESILEGYTFKWDNITNVSFNDVIGMEEVKDIIFKKVMLPFKNPDAFIGYEKNNGGGMLLYGPPGTGKTWEMQHRYIDSYSDDDCFVTTFHQSFSYEEFVEGLKASSVSGSINYSIEPGIFYRACNRAAVLAGYADLDECINDIKPQREAKIAKAPTVLLCIDEINRANVSAVFGDLISLIETSKRLGAGENEMTAILPYSKKKFGVPANLLIVGTMNTADRSIQLLDSALRRRFEFIELLPKLDMVHYAPAKEILRSINLNICAILNKDHQIGHSYFIGVKNDKDIVRIMMTQVIPLLEEYFYNNTEKIKVVLGEANRDFDCIYIKDEDVTKAYKIAVGDTDKQFYKLNPKYLCSTISDDIAREFVGNLETHLIGTV